MEENKILQFVKDFNLELEKRKEDCCLTYENNGAVEAISLSPFYPFDDNNYSAEYSRQIALSHILKFCANFSDVANGMLVEEVDKYFVLIKDKIKLLCPQAILKVKRLSVLRWEIFMSGNYEETEDLSDLIDAITEDFIYIFEGCALTFEY